jgi:hypothetical protein
LGVPGGVVIVPLVWADRRMQVVSRRVRDIYAFI